MIEETKSLIEAPWGKKTTDGLGTRNDGSSSPSTWSPKHPCQRTNRHLVFHLRLRSCDDHRPRH